MKRTKFIIVILFLCILFGGLHITFSAFGNITANIQSKYNVIYISNYPVDEMDNESKEDNGKYNYEISDNKFTVPESYEFINWNTVEEGTGDVYNVGDIVDLNKNITLYAQWKLTVTEEKLKYGDVNNNGKIDEEDYLLVEDYLLNSSILNDNEIMIADVNTDGKIDLVDVDIIKQVCLGTEGYIGFLPENPILIYEVYDSEFSNEDKGENSSENNTGGSGETGDSSGVGDSSTGSNYSNQSSGNNKNNKDEDNSYNKKEKNYELKFIVDGLEYARTKCSVLEDNTCNLVLPVTIPSKKEYKFIGWSIDKDCLSNQIITDPISVDNSETYYACFKENSFISNKKENKKFYIIFILILLWIIGIRIIFYLVKKFRKNDTI